MVRSQRARNFLNSLGLDKVEYTRSLRRRFGRLLVVIGKLGVFSLIKFYVGTTYQEYLLVGLVTKKFLQSTVKVGTSCHQLNLFLAKKWLLSEN